MKRFVAGLAIIFAMPLAAQTIIGDDSTIRLGLGKDITRETREPVSTAPAARLRALDTMSGERQDLEVVAGDVVQFARLDITLHACRYPRNNPTGNAYAHLTIRNRAERDPLFDGWMIASSPALMALEDPRYDVWVIGCKLDDRTPAVVAGESSPRPKERPEVGFGN